MEVVKTQAQFHLERIPTLAEFDMTIQEQIETGACSLLEITSRTLRSGDMEFTIAKEYRSAIKRTNELLQAKGWRIRRRSIVSFFMQWKDEYRIKRL